MTDAAALERGYRRWLRWYPKSFRREHQAEMLGVLMSLAREGQRHPHPVECLDLLRSALRVHCSPRVARSNHAVFAAVTVMYFGAVVELATALTLVATIGDVKAYAVAQDPGLTAAAWNAVFAGQIEPIVVAAGIAVGFWLWMAQITARGHRWQRFAFLLFFAMNTYSLASGLAGGSAVSARADVVVATLLWLVELAAIVLIFRVRSTAAHRSAETSPAR